MGEEGVCTDNSCDEEDKNGDDEFVKYLDVLNKDDDAAGDVTNAGGQVSENGDGLEKLIGAGYEDVRNDGHEYEDGGLKEEGDDIYTGVEEKVLELYMGERRRRQKSQQRDIKTVVQ